MRALIPELRQMWGLGLPLIATHVIQFIIYPIDVAMVGAYNSVEDLPALVLAGAVLFMVFVVGTGFSSAVLALVAQSHAKERHAETRAIVCMSIWFIGLFCLICAPALYFGASVLELFGQDPELSLLAQSYLRIALFGLIASLITSVLRNYLITLEHRMIVFWPALLGVLVNGFLNWIFIFGNWGAPEMGIRGAALASTLAQILTLLIYIGYIQKCLSHYQIFSVMLRPHKEIFKNVVRVGFPIGAIGMAEGGFFTASSFLAGKLGALTLSAHGIVLQLASMSYMIPLGLSGAVTVLIGKALATENYQKFRAQSLCAIINAISIGIFSASIFLLFPEQLIRLFLDSDEPSRDAILAIGVNLLFVAAVFQIFDALQVTAIGLLRGAQDTKIPLYIAAFSYWGVGLPAGYLMALRLGFGGTGVWIGMIFGLGVASILLLLRFGLNPHHRKGGVQRHKLSTSQSLKSILYSK